MSFKRDGDDSSQLNVLKKRRVADLLASYIPEDEALLLKNGRFACAVCAHRPVFDTIDMLSVHRNGKKHLTSLQKFYGRKTEHENEIQKRQHQAFVRAEETGEQAVPAPLLTETRKITHNALLKAAPYNSCCSRKRSSLGSGKVRSPNLDVPSAPLSSFSENQDPSHPTDNNSVTPQTTPKPVFSDQREKVSGAWKEKTSKSKKSSRDKKGADVQGQEGNSCADPDRDRVLQHHLLLKSSGWIPDGTGKWVKDENVEFDSDEEEPPMLPPPN
ncbi:sodium channel modifier 1 isoform X2 [Bombina bombina]|uniref:sodium channel modifier 1 isoform X2 n=1 Tax=Bombina bombina TaxID=8345 RepID=UPI00235AF915|nr:sodium channel modifier 1 isoform X2 [Bombina bombina]